MIDLKQIKAEFYAAEGEKCEVFDVMYKHFGDLCREIERLQGLLEKPTNECSCGNVIDHDYCTKCLRQWES